MPETFRTEPEQEVYSEVQRGETDYFIMKWRRFVDEPGIKVAVCTSEAAASAALRLFLAK